MGSLPRQRHRLKLRQRGRVVERRGIPCEQQVDALVQQIPRVAGSDEKPNGRQVVAGDGDHRLALAAAGVSIVWCDPAGSCSERPRRTGDGLGDRQIGMSERQRRVHALTPQRDRKGSVVDGDDRLDETAHVRPQLVSDAVARPARPHVSRRDRRAVGETGVLPQRDDPGAAVCVEPPGRCQAWTDTSLAVDSDQRLVELTEQQSLALVRRARCVRRIDSVGEGDGRDRFARFSDQRAVDGVGLGTERLVPAGGRRWRLWRAGRPCSGGLAVGPAVARRALPPGWCASCTPMSSPEGRR